MSYRKENERWLVYHIQGIGYIPWNKVECHEAAILDSEESADKFLESTAEKDGYADPVAILAKLRDDFKEAYPLVEKTLGVWQSVGDTEEDYDITVKFNSRVEFRDHNGKVQFMFVASPNKVTLFAQGGGRNPSANYSLFEFDNDLLDILGMFKKMCDALDESYA